MANGVRARLTDFGALAPAVWAAGDLPVVSPMQSYEWLSTAADVYGQGAATSALVVGDVESPRGLAVLNKSGGMNALRLTGSIDLGEAVELLYADEGALDELAKGLCRLGVAVDLGHYPTDSDLAGRMRLAQGARGLTVARSLSGRAMPSLPLDERWKKPLELCGRSRRQQYRRKWRKAEAIGAVDVEILTPTEGEVDRLLDRIMAVEAQGWKGRAGTALKHDPKQAEFFRHFGLRMAARGELRICMLTIDGRDAAMTYAVVWQNRFWAIKVGYDDQFAAVSPGEALLVELIRTCAESGYDSFEFCGKEAPWTLAWTEEAVEIGALRFYPWSIPGVGRLVADSWVFARRRLSGIRGR